MYNLKNRVLILLVSFVATACSTNGSRFYDSAMNDRNRAPASLNLPSHFDNEVSEKADRVRTQIDADYYFLKSDLESQSGQVAQSIETLKAALALDPNAPTLMQKIAVEYYKRGQVRDAIYWAEKARAESKDRRDIVLLLAGLYTTAKQYPKAEAEYLKLLKKDKDDTEAVLYLGAVYSETKNYPKAIEKFQSLTKNPNYPSKHLAYYYLARIYQEQGGKESNEKIKSALAKSLDIRPEFFESVAMMAQTIQKTAGFEKAIKFYMDHQKKHGPNPRISEILAQYYIEKNQYDLAYEQLEVVESQADDSLQVKLKMALILIDKKVYEKAVVKLNEILAVAPESDKVRFYLSAVYEEMKDLPRAFDEYMKITKESSYFEEARVHAAFIAKSLGQKETAQKVIEETIKLKGESSQSYFLMAQFHEENKDLKKALDVVAQAESKFPDNTQVLFYKGTLQDRMNLKKDMIVTMKKILSLDQDHVQAMNYLAYTWAEMNIELESAEKYARLAVGKEPQDGFIMDTLGWVLFKQGRLKEAIKVLEKAHEMLPQVGIIAEHLGDVYFKLSRFEQSKEFMLKALEYEVDVDKKKEIQQKLSQIETTIRQRRPASASGD